MNNYVPAQCYKDNEPVEAQVGELMLPEVQKISPGATYERLERSNRLDLVFLTPGGKTICWAEVKNRGCSEAFFKREPPAVETQKVSYARTKREPVYLVVVCSDGPVLIYDLKSPQMDDPECDKVWSDPKYDQEEVRKHRPATQAWSFWKYNTFRKRFDSLN